MFEASTEKGLTKNLSWGRNVKKFGGLFPRLRSVKMSGWQKNTAEPEA